MAWSWQTTLICQKRVEPVRFHLAAQGLLIRYLLYTLFAPDGISPGGDCEFPFPTRLELGPVYIYPRKVAFATGHDAVSIGPRARKSWSTPSARTHYPIHEPQPSRFEPSRNYPRHSDAVRIESRRRIERSPIRRLTRRAVSFIQRRLAVAYNGRKVLV